MQKLRLNRYKTAGTVNTFKAATGMPRPKGIPTISGSPRIAKPMSPKANTPAVSTTIKSNQANTDVTNTSNNTTVQKLASAQLRHRAVKAIHQFTDRYAAHHPKDEITDMLISTSNAKQNIEDYLADLHKTSNKKGEFLMQSEKLAGLMGTLTNTAASKANSAVKRGVGTLRRTARKAGASATDVRQLNVKNVRTAGNVAAGAAGGAAAYGAYKAVTDDNTKTAADKAFAAYKDFQRNIYKTAAKLPMTTARGLKAALPELKAAAKSGNPKVRREAFEKARETMKANAKSKDYQFGKKNKMVNFGDK